jgi:NAD(P)-dependent dehydrogenase (short-subunit alcohol dehydrogenase family)
MARQRIALVTGANRGIGLEIVRQLARAGLKTVLAARDLKKGTDAAARLTSEGITPEVVALDVREEDSVRAAIEHVTLRIGPIDVLVNNAAILKEGFSPSDTSVLDLPLALAQETLDSNTLGPLRLIKAVAPGMVARRYGRIVNVSSLAGQLAHMGAGFPAYRMSKAALNALTRIVADEIGPGPVKVNAMSPGWVRTDMGGPHAERSVEEGADTAVWLATLPDDGPTGGFFEDRRPVAW